MSTGPGATVAETAALGVRRVSLNFAVFRSVFARGERLGAGPVLRVWRAVLLWASDRRAPADAVSNTRRLTRQAKTRSEPLPRHRVMWRERQALALRGWITRDRR